MRIALFDDRYFSAYGAQRVMVSLAGHLRDRGWSPTVVTGGQGPLTDLAAAAGVPVRVVPIRPDLDIYGGEALRLSPAGKARLLRSLVGYAREVEHALDDLGTELLVANALRPLLYSVSARLHRRPVLWLLQGGEQFGALSYVAPFIPHRTMTVSRGARAAVPPLLRPLVEARSFVNHPGIDLARYHPVTRGGRESLGLPSTATIVLVAGRVDRNKGFDVAIEALHLARRDVDDLHLAVAGRAHGTSDAEFEQLLRRRAAELQVPVSFLGWVEDMPTLMSNVDVFVLSSRREGFGLVTVEAMATGLPVIVTRAGGSEETVEDGVSGLLVPPDDPRALADALVRVASDDALRQRLAAAGRARAVERYTTEQFVDRFVDDVCTRFPRRPSRSVAGP